MDGLGPFGGNIPPVVYQVAAQGGDVVVAVELGSKGFLQVVQRRGAIHQKLTLAEIDD